MLPEPFGHILYVIGDAAFVIVLILCVAFSVSYRYFFNWRKRPAGRAILRVFDSLSGFALLSVLGAVFGPGYFGREALRLILALLIMVTMARLLYVLWSRWGAGEPPVLPEPREHPRTTSPTPAPRRTPKEDQE